MTHDHDAHRARILRPGSHRLRGEAGALQQQPPAADAKQRRQHHPAGVRHLKPFLGHRELGDDLRCDGLLAWLRFGINVTFTRDVLAVSMRFSDGGGMMVITNSKVFPLLFPGGFP